MSESKQTGVKEKVANSSAVSKGEKSVKSDSKFGKEEQIAYARGQFDARNALARIKKQIAYAKGQRDARNEQNSFYKYKNSTAEESKAYKEKKALEYAKYKASKE